MWPSASQWQHISNRLSWEENRAWRHLQYGSLAHKGGYAKIRTNLWQNSNDRISHKVSLGTTIIVGPISNQTQWQKPGRTGPTLKKSHILEIILVTSHNIQDVDQKFTLQIEGETTKWMLHWVLMQLGNPNQEECSFVHAIDRSQTRNGITVVMLPNAALHSCNAVHHLLPFTEWILEPTLGP